MASPETHALDRRAAYLPVIILVAATALCLLPFIGKAFNIDDPLFIWAAQHIRLHPLNPYGFDVNWYGRTQPMSQVTQNPPLACYYIALVSCLVGWSEAGIHLFMIIPAVAVILGTYRLARRRCANPLYAALIALLTPVFLVSSTTVMCDVLMLAFWTWAAALWTEGMDDDRGRRLLIAAVLIAVAILTKYYAVVLIPLLLFYSLLRKRRLGWWAAYLLIPICILGLYELATHALYGRELFLGATAYANAQRVVTFAAMSRNMLVGTIFFGGCFLPLAFYAPLIWSRKYLMIGAAAIAVAGYLIFRSSSVDNGDWSAVPWSPIAQMSPYVVVGAVAIVLAVLNAIKGRDADSIFLCLWVLGTYIFSNWINWSINGRSILPAVPAVGILIVRGIELRHKTTASLPVRRMLLPLILGAAFSLCVTYGDLRQANATRASVDRVLSWCTAKGKTMQFDGHWGFQYYMLKAGAVEADAGDCRLGAGEVVAMDQGTPDTLGLPARLFTKIHVIKTPVNACVATMSREVRAAFYSSGYGPLPFAIGQVPPSQVDIIESRTTVFLKDDALTTETFRNAVELERAGKLDEAVVDYRAALYLQPDLWQAANSLAWILATNPRLREPAEAVQLAEAAVGLTNREQPSVLDTMAVAYASAGRYDEAAATAEEAASLCESQHQPDGARFIRGRIALYKAHKPYLEPASAR